jgi:uncharacterized protein (TIGR02266 family)
VAPADRSERRVSERVAIEAEVSLTSDSQFFVGVSGDISQGGLFAQTYKPVPLGSRVLLAIFLPTGDIVTRGVVRWARPATEGAPPGLGICFDALLSSERAAIEAFCRTRPPLYHEVEEA